MVVLVHGESRADAGWFQVGLGVVQQDVGRVQDLLDCIEQPRLQQHPSEHGCVVLHVVDGQHLQVWARGSWRN